MTTDVENANDPTTGSHTGVHSGRRVELTLLRVAVVMAAGLIVAYVFDGVALFMSMKNKAPPPTPTSPITDTVPTESVRTPVRLCCDEGWLLHGQKCFHFSNMQTSWDISRRMCAEMGGNLVKIESRAEQEFLFEKVKELKKFAEEMFWMGLTDADTEGDWRWTDGSSLNQSLAFWFVRGTANEPDNWTTQTNPQGEDCAQMGARVRAPETLAWFDVPCTIGSRFMCEKQPRSTGCQQELE